MTIFDDIILGLVQARDDSQRTEHDLIQRFQAASRLPASFTQDSLDRLTTALEGVREAINYVDQKISIGHAVRNAVENATLGNLDDAATLSYAASELRKQWDGMSQTDAEAQVRYWWPALRRSAPPPASSAPNADGTEDTSDAG